MNLIERAKNIIVTPKTEWPVIENENMAPNSVITTYVIPLAAIAAAAAFIGYGVIGYSVLGIKVGGVKWGLYQALTILISAILSVLVSALIIDALAPTFKSEKNINKSIQLTAFAYTPAWIGGLLSVLPAIAFLGSLFGLYGLYLLYVGLPIMKKTPEEQKTSYYVISLIVMIAAFFVMGLIFARIFMNIFDLATPSIDIDSMMKNLK